MQPTTQIFNPNAQLLPSAANPQHANFSALPIFHCPKVSTFYQPTLAKTTGHCLLAFRALNAPFRLHPLSCHVFFIFASQKERLHIIFTKQKQNRNLFLCDKSAIMQSLCNVSANSHFDLDNKRSCLLQLFRLPSPVGKNQNVRILFQISPIWVECQRPSVAAHTCAIISYIVCIDTL
jgi:hypothetical protein